MDPPFTLSGPDNDGLVWLMSGEGLRKEMREAVAVALLDAIKDQIDNEDNVVDLSIRKDLTRVSIFKPLDLTALADIILSLPGISTSYGINMGAEQEAIDLFLGWLAERGYGEPGGGWGWSPEGGLTSGDGL